MSNDPFESPKLLIARAKENAADFKTRCQSWVDSNPCVEFAEMDLKTGEKVVKFRLEKPLPSDARPVLSDAFNNLRHSLDQAVNASAVLLRGGAMNCYFPIGKDAKEFVGIFDSKRFKKIPIDLQPYLAGLQPYFGGDDLLWALGTIAGPNKHQITLDVEPRIAGGKAFGGRMANGVAVTFKWDAAKKEMELARIGPHGEFQMDLSLTYEIKLGRAKVVGGQPALAVFDTFLGKTESVVNGIEAETARILASRNQS